MEQIFCVKGNKNKLPAEAKNKAMSGYPLHKALAENKAIGKKYGKNGMGE